MDNDYLRFLDYRAAQRSLLAKFAHPRGLLLHTLAFLTAITAMYVYWRTWEMWLSPASYQVMVLIGLLWSVALGIHGLLHYRRSAAIAERREVAVEATMRELIEKDGAAANQADLFDLHRQLEAELERRGSLSLALTAFALINMLSWVGSVINMGTNWGFFTTLPFAVGIIGGVYGFKKWQRERAEGQTDLFTRLPLRHIAAYMAGVIGLALLGAYHLINSWDAVNLIEGWGVLLALHVILVLILMPIWRWARPETRSASKRKPAARLLLSDDGEVEELIDEAQYPQHAPIRR